MGDVLSDYHTGDAFDEMMDGEGSVRPSYQAVYSALSRSTSDDLRIIAESLANNYTQAGVTFDVGGVETAIPARFGAAGDCVTGVGDHRVRRRAAGASARGVPLRYLLRCPGDLRRRHSQPADHLLHPFPPRGVGHSARQRRTHPCRRAWT